MFVRAQQLLKNNIQYPQKKQNYANTFLFLWNNSKYANMCFYSFFLYFYTKNWALWIRMYIVYTVQMTLGRSYVDTKYSMSVPFARYNSSFPPGKWISGKNDGLSELYGRKPVKCEIFLHSLLIGRSVIEDPPSISEGSGGRVTDYR